MDYKARKYDNLVWTPIKHIVGFADMWRLVFFNYDVVLDKNTHEKSL